MNGRSNRFGLLKNRVTCSLARPRRGGAWCGLLACLVAVLVLLAVGIVGCGEDEAVTTQAPVTTAALADGEVYEFKLSLHNPADSPEDQFFDGWAEEVEEATNGRVKITVFPGAVLGSPTDGLTMVQTGVCDILWSFTGFFPAEFKATSSLALPLLLPGSAQENTVVYWDVIESRPEILEEFDNLGLKLLEIHAGPTAILGGNKPVTSVDDLMNFKVRVGGGPLTDAVVAWGGSPIAMPPNELYESLQKNVIDGYIFDPAGVLPYKVYEPVDYFLDLPFSANPLFTVMNQDKWNQLPADLQEIMMSLIGRAPSYAFAEVQDGSTAELWAIIDDAGKTVTVATEEVVASFQPGADEAIAKWVEEKAADGIDSTGLVSAIVEFVQKDVEH